MSLRKKVPATLGADGRLAFEEAPLKEICEGIDLNEDFARLFPALPKESVAPGGAWKDVFERHTDSYALKSVVAKVAAFEGTSKADETNGAGALQTSLKAEGTFSGEWDLDAGRLRVFEEARKEETKLETKSSVMATTAEMKRRVEVEKAK